MHALYLSLFSLVSLMNLPSPTSRSKPVRTLCQRTLAQITEQTGWGGITQERELSNPIEIQLLFLIKYSTGGVCFPPTFLWGRQCTGGERCFPDAFLGTNAFGGAYGTQILAFLVHILSAALKLISSSRMDCDPFRKCPLVLFHHGLRAVIMSYCAVTLMCATPQ